MSTCSKPGAVFDSSNHAVRLEFCVAEVFICEAGKILGIFLVFLVFNLNIYRNVAMCSTTLAVSSAPTFGLSCPGVHSKSPPQ